MSVSNYYTINRAGEVYDGVIVVGSVQSVREAYTAGMKSRLDDDGVRRLYRVEKYRSGWIAQRADGSFVEGHAGPIVLRTRREWCDPRAWVRNANPGEQKP